MGKILITGPGRSGTTFIVQMLTRLGFDTGFKPGEEHYHPNLRAGCEWTIDVDLEKDSAEKISEVMKAGPRVLKSPEWGMILALQNAMQFASKNKITTNMKPRVGESLI